MTPTLYSPFSDGIDRVGARGSTTSTAKSGRSGDGEEAGM